MSKQPWMKFFPSDWRADPALRICSLAARGLWIEMVSIMHEATPRGELLIKGKPPTEKQLGAIVGAGIDEVTELLSELEDAGVFNRRKTGVIYSRRMRKEAEKSEKMSRNGRLGVEAKSLKTKETPDLHKPNSSPRSQKPEARSQKEYIVQFEEFWKAYPHPPNKGSKKAAEKKFIQALKSKTELSTLLAGAKSLGDYCKATAWYSPPMALTWLNQERWETMDTSEKEFRAPESGWEDVVQKWQADHSRWSSRWGPPPDHPDTLVPAALTEAA